VAIDLKNPLENGAVFLPQGPEILLQPFAGWFVSADDGKMVRRICHKKWQNVGSGSDLPEKFRVDNSRKTSETGM
jgi:hypothetical protein